MAASDHLHPDQWRATHRPDMEGSSIHNMEDMFGPDVYTHPHYYAHGEKTHDREASRSLRAAQGKPESMVDVYRSVPHGISSINTGDWVTTSPSYARQHGMQNDPSEDWPVLHAQVQAAHVRSGGNDIIEWGYAGPSIEKARVHHPGGSRASA